jgi:F-type H+-transporting ATPase subunit delta
LRLWFSYATQNASFIRLCGEFEGVGTVSGKSGLVAGRYAAALIDLASEHKSLENVEKDLTALRAMVDGSADLRRLVENPLISRDQQQKAILALAAKAGFHALTANFLGVLAQNRRLGALPAILDAFANEVMRRRGGVNARVETAFALSPAQTKSLQEQLSKAMGSNVTLDVSVNKDLLGGMIVTVGSKQIDDSVKRKLERLKRAMNDKAA